MKKTIALSTAVLAAAFTFAPLASAEDAPAQRQQGQAMQQQENQQQEQEFLKNAWSDNQFEIQAGQYVGQHTQNAQVKQLAERLQQDHSKAQQQLEQTAKELNFNIAQQLSPVDQAKWEELQKNEGEALDRCFVFGQVGDHAQDILANQWQADYAPSQQVKQYAQQVVPVLREHEQMARQTADQFVPEARQAGMHLRGTGQATSGAEGGELNGTNGSTGQPSGTGKSGQNTGINR